MFCMIICMYDMYDMFPNLAENVEQRSSTGHFWAETLLRETREVVGVRQDTIDMH